MPLSQAKILIIDDEPMIRFAFTEFLKDEGHMPLAAENAEAAMELLLSQQPEIVFLDYRLPGRDGLHLLEEILAKLPDTAVVFMTAFGAMEVVIKAMQHGAYEYLTKPLDLDRVRELINRILAGRRLLRQNHSPGPVAAAGETGTRIVGNSVVMQEIYKMIGLLTTREVTVLITGESGVGKELVARAIHENSPRRQQPFIAVNCGALPEGLLESEMFGHEKGAFTSAEATKIGKFEAARQGTVFLDEIAEMRPAMQVKLLRVLQERSFERVGGNVAIRSQARVIVATNKDLQEEVAAGHFRKDLFYRLYLIHINIPPLRERVEDVPLLAEHFIARANAELRRQVRGLAESALPGLMKYPWPGNVRELENRIKRAMVLSPEDILTADLFELADVIVARERQNHAARLVDTVRASFSGFLDDPDLASAPMEHMVRIVEKTLIEEALGRTHGNQVKAAELLGAHRSTLRNKIKDYGLG